MFKKTIFLFLLVTLTYFMGYAYDFCVDGIYYNIINDQTPEVEVAPGDSPVNNYSGDVVIPQGVEHEGLTYTVSRIGEFAFFKSTELTSVVLPESITSIGTAAFSFCSLLSELIIPENVTEIEASAFSRCTSLKSVAIPSGITEIRDWTFENCRSLETVNLPPEVSSIGVEAFGFCYALRSIEIGEQVKSIGYGAFSECSSLERVTLPHGISSIERNTFSGCTSLKEVTIGKEVSEIKAYAFVRCTSLEKFVSYTAVPPVCAEERYGGVFSESNYNNAVLSVPETCMEAYSTARQWQDFGIIEGFEYVFESDEIAPVDGLYYSGTDGRLYHLDDDGNTTTIESELLPHTFQLLHVRDRIYGASAGENFGYGREGTPGDGKLFYISTHRNGETTINTVFDNTSGLHNRDPYGLAAYNDDIYFFDKNESIKKISYQDRNISQDYPSWMENSWISFYGNGWSYNCIKGDLQITEGIDSDGNPEPVFWLSVNYNGNGLFRFKSEAISNTGYGSSSYNRMYLIGIYPKAIYIDEANDHLYISSFRGSWPGLYRLKLSTLPRILDSSNPEGLLIDDSEIYDEPSESSIIAIPQLNVDNTGEYLYWCYRAEYPGNSAIKRLKLGQENPVVETVAKGVDAYGVVAINYRSNNESSVPEIITEDQSENPVEYYNLQGIRIAEPQPGTLVIRRQGSEVRKIRW